MLPVSREHTHGVLWQRERDPHTTFLRCFLLRVFSVAVCFCVVQDYCIPREIRIPKGESSAMISISYPEGCAPSSSNLMIGAAGMGRVLLLLLIEAETKPIDQSVLAGLIVYFRLVKKFRLLYAAAAPVMRMTSLRSLRSGVLFSTRALARVVRRGGGVPSAGDGKQPPLSTTNSRMRISKSPHCAITYLLCAPRSLPRRDVTHTHTVVLTTRAKNRRPHKWHEPPHVPCGAYR